MRLGVDLDVADAVDRVGGMGQYLTGRPARGAERGRELHQLSRALAQLLAEIVAGQLRPRWTSQAAPSAGLPSSPATGRSAVAASSTATSTTRPGHAGAQRRLWAALFPGPLRRVDLAQNECQAGATRRTSPAGVTIS